MTDKQSFSLNRDKPSVVARGQKIWKCFCQIGFTGDDCTTPTETECQDNEDNDNGEKYFSYIVLDESYSYIAAFLKWTGRKEGG